MRLFKLWKKALRILLYVQLINTLVSVLFAWSVESRLLALTGLVMVKIADELIHESEK